MAARLKSKRVEAKTSRRTVKPRARGDMGQLRELAQSNTPTRVLGLKLGRKNAATQSRESIPNPAWDSINTRVSKEFERVAGAFKLRDQLEARFTQETRELKRKFAEG